jgi:hypothetical protein
MIWIETRSQEQTDAWRSSVRVVAYGSSNPTGRSDARKAGANDNVMRWADALEEIRRDPQSRLTIAVRHLPKPAAFREACRALRQQINTRLENRVSHAEELFALHRLAAIASVATHDQLEVIPFSMVEALNLDPMMIGWKALPLLGEKDAVLMEALWGPPVQHVTGAILYPGVALAAAAHLSDLRKEEAKRSLPLVGDISRNDLTHVRFTAGTAFARFAGWVGRRSRRSTAG